VVYVCTWTLSLACILGLSQYDGTLYKYNKPLHENILSVLSSSQKEKQFGLRKKCRTNQKMCREGQECQSLWNNLCKRSDGRRLEQDWTEARREGS